MTADRNVPFNRLYVNPKFKDTRFAEVYVAPVNTDYVMAENVWEKATLANVNKDDVEKNVDLLGNYMRNAFVKAFQNDSKKRFKVVDKPGPDTLIPSLDRMCAMWVLSRLESPPS